MPIFRDYSHPEEGEMSQDSNNTDQSSVSGDSGAEHSDSDDSSTMDEDDNERRRIECQEKVDVLERQFVLLKEQLYHEQMTQLNQKVQEIEDETAEEYSVPLMRLQEKMETKMEVAEVLQEMRRKNIEHKYEGEKKAAEDNLKNEKTILRNSIYSDLQEKIRRLEEDKNLVDIHEDLWLSSTGRRRRGHNKRKRTVYVNGPYIVYMLNESEILEDWTLIRKSLSCRNAGIMLNK
ncbi:breast cancer metastasis-suppressor 1-like protein [Diachasma alloeum]|uniref:breast cancer metastasis-suppressor 1-like protein n=1 Tax=Diachasma alloeum TaxID=454923 RepID=UPI0007381ECC|nr:breast cancer metastasis-suppressor 1-like protein [Diachasma alloeum]